MSNLYSSSGDIRFYNYISPSFYSGVPVGSVDKDITQFLSEHAFSSIDFFNSGNDYYVYRFPQVNGTPTQRETTTAQISATANGRGFFRMGSGINDRRSIAIGSPAKTTNMSPLTTGLNIGAGSTTWSSLETFKFSTSSLLTALDGSTSVILFITKSPTSMIFGECWFDSNTYQPLTNPSRFNVVLTGWMHDSIFFNSANPIASYYTTVFSTTSSSLFVQNLTTRRLTTSASTASVTLEHRFYDIICQTGTGTYNGENIFLTDIILYDRGVPGIQIGKVDNRIACLGRGNLQQGRIYRTINPFGRTGTEYWLCLGCYVPDETKWQKTPSELALPASLFRTWDINNRDYILQRIQLRPDLP